jgi:hypothetical protein
MSHESLPPTAESASPPKRWQFRLWHLFAVTTYVAVVIAMARRWGIETLPVTIGIGIAWLNFAGALSFLQQGKLQLAILFVAWGMFLGSLFLPTHTEWGVPGYAAAWFVLGAPLDICRRPNWLLQLTKYLCWALFIDVANVLQLLLPVTAVRLLIGRGKYLAAVNCVSMVAVWAIAGPTAASGYILWCASFLLTLAAMPLNRATLVVMHIALATQIAYWLITGEHW